MGWKTFNDRLAILGFLGIPGLWVLGHWYPMPPQAVGATIVVWTLIANFYFRKAPPASKRGE